MFQDPDLPDDASEDTIEKLCIEKAEQKFQELCVEPLKKINPELRYARSSGVIVFYCTEGGIPDLRRLQGCQRGKMQNQTDKPWIACSK
jgi:hypothetical protein